ncbi:MAG TPA: TrbI/VirB10 family protein [Candidatus Acidoferrales bacterium]
MNESIQDQTPKPPGLLPKNVQSWLLVSIALVMVLIMWLTGGKKPPSAPKPGAVPIAVQPPLEVNETKIAELQSRIENLQRDQLVAQNALEEQNRQFGPLTQSPENSPQGLPTASSPSNQPAEDPIEVERKKRAYVSLFSSNVALTYRKGLSESRLPEGESAPSEPAPSANSPAPGPDATQVAQALKDLLPLGPPPAAAPLSAPPVAPSGVQGSSAKPLIERKEEAHLADGLTATATGKDHMIFEGTILETVLINRLEGQFSGPLECLLTTDVYSHDRQHLLIPSGTKLLGETKKVENSGQTRLAVVFHRLLMPDGYSVSLDQFKGLDQIGDTGLRDQVNNHYLRIFGVSLAIGAIGAVAEAGTGGGLNASSGELMRQGFAGSVAQSSSQILDRFLNILPTVAIREGHRVKVYLSGDLVLPDYNNHTIPSNL